MSATAASERWNSPPRCLPSSGPPNSEMSAPAAKIFGPPVTTTAPGGMARRSVAISSSSVSTRDDSALTLPLCNVMTATPSLRRSMLTSSPIPPTLVTHPSAQGVRLPSCPVWRFLTPDRAAVASVSVKPDS